MVHCILQFMALFADSRDTKYSEYRIFIPSPKFTWAGIYTSPEHIHSIVRELRHRISGSPDMPTCIPLFSLFLPYSEDKSVGTDPPILRFGTQSFLYYRNIILLYQCNPSIVSKVISIRNPPTSIFHTVFLS